MLDLIQKVFEPRLAVPVRGVLFRCCASCFAVDWRTYTCAVRSRCRAAERVSWPITPSRRRRPSRLESAASSWVHRPTSWRWVWGAEAGPQLRQWLAIHPWPAAVADSVAPPPYGPGREGAQAARRKGRGGIGRGRGERGPARRQEGRVPGRQPQDDLGLAALLESPRQREGPPPQRMVRGRDAHPFDVTTALSWGLLVGVTSGTRERYLADFQWSASRVA